MDSKDTFSTEFNIPKQQNIKIDVDQLLKKSLEGKNIAVLFEGEIQKKLIAPLFSNINDAIQKTSIDLKSIDLNKFLEDSFKNIKLDEEPVRLLNSTFNKKINEIAKNFEDINVKNLQRTLEQKIVKQINQVESISEASTNNNALKMYNNQNIINTLLKPSTELSIWTRYKYNTLALKLLDKLDKGINDFEIAVEGKIKPKDLLQLITNNTASSNVWNRYRYSVIVDHAINLLKQGVDQLTVKSEDNITSKDLLNVLFSNKAEDIAEYRKKYHTKLDDILKNINIPLTDVQQDDTTDTTSKRTQDKEAEEDLREKGTVFQHKEFFLADETLKKLKDDQIDSFIIGDLATNNILQLNNKELIKAINAIKFNAIVPSSAKPLTTAAVAAAMAAGAGSLLEKIRKLFSGKKEPVNIGERTATNTRQSKPTAPSKSNRNSTKSFNNSNEIRDTRSKPTTAVSTTSSPASESSLNNAVELSKYIGKLNAAAGVAMVMQPVTIGREDRFNDYNELLKIQNIKDPNKQKQEDTQRKQLVADRAVNLFINKHQPVPDFLHQYRDILTEEEIIKIKAEIAKPEPFYKKLTGPTTIQDVGIPESIKNIAIKKYDENLIETEKERAKQIQVKYQNYINKPAENTKLQEADAPVPNKATPIQLDNILNAKPIEVTVRTLPAEPNYILKSPAVDFTPLINFLSSAFNSFGINMNDIMRNVSNNNHNATVSNNATHQYNITPEYYTNNDNSSKQSYSSRISDYRESYKTSV